MLTSIHTNEDVYTVYLYIYTYTHMQVFFIRIYMYNHVYMCIFVERDRLIDGKRGKGIDRQMDR